jgi:hypothetical protein
MYYVKSDKMGYFLRGGKDFMNIEFVMNKNRYNPMEFTHKSMADHVAKGINKIRPNLKAYVVKSEKE